MSRLDANPPGFDAIAKMVYAPTPPGGRRVGFGTMALLWMDEEKRREDARRERAWMDIE